jgi:gliding motility-associated-like protein
MITVHGREFDLNDSLEFACPALVITDPPAVCAPGSVDLTLGSITAGSSLAGASLTYWTDAAATIPLANPSAVTISGTYYIQATSPDPCVDIKPVTVTIFSAPLLTITNPAPACAAATVNITAPSVTSGSTLPAGTVLSYWTDAGATSSLANPSAVAVSGTYYIKAATPDGCNDIKPVVVTINPTPSLTISNPAAKCAPGTVNLTAPAVTAGSTLPVGTTLTYWTDAGATSSLANPSTVATPGTYYIKAATPDGCSDIQPVTVTIYSTPALIITNPAPVCAPASVDLTAPSITAGSTSPAGTTLTYWTNAGATSSLANPSAVPTIGTYYIKAVTPDGCSDIKPVIITIYSAPVLFITNPTPVCAPATVDLTAISITSGSPLPAGSTLTYWTDGGATSSLANPSAVSTSGTYYIKAITPDGCSDIEPAIVTIYTAPTLTITNPASVCAPATINLTAPSITSGSTLPAGTALTYWTDAGGTSSLANPSAVATSGTYYIRAVTPDGCSNIKPVVITIYSAPTLVITNPGPACSPATIDLTAASVTSGSTLPAGTTLTYWTNAGATTSLANPSSVATSETYYIKAVAPGGCSVDIKPVTTTINAQPTVTAPNSLCAGSTATLSPTTGVTWVSNDPLLADVTNAGVISGVAPGSVTFTFTATATGCSKTTTPVTINATPAVTVSSAGFCDAAPVTITANVSPAGTYNYAWTVPAPLTDPGNVQGFSTTTAGTYTVIVTNPSNGCSSQSASGTVGADGGPVITVQPEDNLICSNNSAALFYADATNTTGVKWQISTDNGVTWSDVSGATGKSYTFNPQPSESGHLYRAIFTNSCGSDTTDIALLNVGTGVNFPKNLEGEASCTAGQSLSSKITGGVGLSGVLTWYWQRSPDNNAWATIPGTTQSHPASGNYSPSYSPLPGETNYFFRLAVNNNGCVTYSLPAKLTINPVPILNQPANVEICHNNPVTVNFTGTDVSSYSWTNSNTAIGLGASGNGNISFTAINNTAAPITATITVTPHNTDNSLDCPGAPKQFIITVNPLPVVGITFTNVSCNGGNNGTATANASVGPGPYTYSWNTLPVQTTQTATGLTAGTYTVTVTDAKGCKRIGSITITQPPVITASPVATPVKVLCSGAATGAVNLTVNATGGTVPLTYIYLWSNSATTQNISGLTAGSYSVTITVKDANNCQKTFTASAVITQPPPFISGASAPPILCSGGTTTVTATASGGTTISGGKYQFSINGTTFTSSTSPITFTGISAGSYTVTVRDANGCTSTTPITIAPAPPAIIISASAPPILCNGGTTTITVSASGGSPPLQYSLNGSPYQAGNTFTNKTPGSYTITVRDANACTTTKPLIVAAAPPAMNVSASAAPIVCFGGKTTIIVTASGGTPTFEYSLDGITFQPGNTFANIAPGSYTITVRDANGCTKTTTVVIGPTPPALLAAAMAPFILCSGGTTTITATASGGTPFGGGKYEFSINSITFTQSSNPFTYGGMAAGTYTITVRDSKGCLATTPITINTGPLPIIASASAPTVCLGLTSTITVTASGGTGVLQYRLNSGAYQLSNVFNNVAAGAYTITVKDANGCTTTTPVSVLTYPLPPAPTATPVSRCRPGSVTLDASNCNGTINWFATSSGGSPIGTATPFTPPDISGTTTFYLSCTDGNGCVSPRSSVIATVIPIPVVVASSNSPVCEGSSIILSATSFTGTYVWTGPNGYTVTTTSSSVTIPNATLAMAGTYTVIVTVNGCPSLPSSVDVIVNPKIPPVAIPGERCGTGPITLGASGCSGTLNWYSSSIGGSSLGTGTTFVTSSVTAPGTVTYYVSCTVGACVSPRTPVVGTAKIIPVCSITGPNNICPGLTSTYTAPAGMDTYAWTISGNGTIQGVSDGQTISVLGGATCGSYTLSLSISLNGCTNTCSQVFSITDITKPVITSTGTALTLGCNPDAATIIAALGTATATDNCSVGSPTFSDGPVTNVGCTYSQTRTWNVLDICGNAAIPVSRTVTWTVDLTLPLITVTPSTTLPCNPTATQIAAAFGTASVTDNCSTGLTATFTDGAETAGAGCSYSVTRLWTVTDACNNTGTKTQTVTFTRDIVDPVITVTASTALACNPTTAQIASAFGTASVTDNCSTGLTATFTDGAETAGAGCSFSVTRTWTVTDACNNTGTKTQTVIFTRDLVDPVITVTPSTALACNPTATQIAAAFGTASVTDNCSTGLTATFTDGAETAGAGCSFSVTRTWTVTDACNNTGTKTQTVTFTRDLVDPIITVTPSTTLPCNPTAAQIAAAFGTASVTDNCSTGLTATFTDGTETAGAGCSYSVTRTWTVTDACNNTGTKTQTVTFTRDLVDPIITVTPSTALACNPTATQIAAAFGTASVTDNCSTGLTATFTDGAETAGAGCSYSVTRTWTVTDACNNTGTNIQTVIFTRDLVDPVITVTPSTALACNPTATQIAAAFGTASVTDNCSTGLTATFTDGAETAGAGCSYSVTRTWTVTDACNNSGTQTQTVTFIRDTQKPVAVGTASIAIPGCNPSTPVSFFLAPLATDNCGTPALKAGYPQTSTVSIIGCTSSQTRTWIYVDQCGNESDPFVQTISWTTDLQKPTVTGTATITGNTCNVKPSFVDPTASDNCGSTSLKAGYPQDGTVIVTGCTSSQTRTWVYVDPCGNESLPFIQTISWTADTQKPTVTGTATITGSTCNVKPAFVDPSATDNCGATTLKAGYPQDGTVDVTGCTSSQTRTWIYMDPCGNESAPFVQTMTWTTDIQKPTITGTATITGSTCNVKPLFVDPTATDNCGSTSLKTGYPIDGMVTVAGCTSSQTRTWIYVDPCGNESAPFVQTISWTADLQKPTVTGTATITGNTCNVKPVFVDPTATDNCGLTTLKAAYPLDGAVVVTGCTSSQTRTWIYVDPCGNESDPFIQTILWTADTEKPTVTGTATITGSTCNVKQSFVDPTATDNGGSTTLKAGYPQDGTIVVIGCTSSQTRTWIYVDPCGNESDPFVQTISWTTDTQKPTLTGTATITGSTCNVKLAFVDPTATDNCGATTLKTGYPQTSTIAAAGCTSTQTRTWIYVDPCGNESDPFVQTISWTIDTQKPTVTGTATITGSTCNVKPAFVDPTATDNCGTTTLKAGYPIDGTVATTGCASTQTRTWIYVDPCGNESDPFIQTISWTVDTQKPTVTGTATINGSTCNVQPAFVDPTASDNCGSTTLKAGYPIDGTVIVTGCTSSQTRTWIYVDRCGNESLPFIQTISWTADTQKPTITGTATITGSTCNVKPSFADPTASDNCGSTIIKAGYPIDGSVIVTGCTSSQTRTWIYVDPCGNESAPFVQTISWTADLQKPTVTGTANITGTTCNVKPAFVDPTASDNCGSTTLKAGYPQDGTVAITGCTSSQTRTWIYVDPCGNESAPFVQTISWTADLQKPTVTGTATITGTTCNVKPVFVDPTATDNCGSTILKAGYPIDGTVTVTGCTSSQTRTWIYVDPCGNESDPFIQTITWTTDTQKPIVTGTATITGTTCNVKPAFVDPAATDNCGSTTLKAGYPIDGTVTVAGCTSSQTRTWIYVDPCGNESAPFVQTISWTTDTQKPTITGTTTITGSTCNVKPAFIAPTATDNCGSATLKAGYPIDGTVTVTGCTSSQTRTWIYVDPCGNESDPFVQTITWTTDTQKPTVTGTATITGTTCNVKPLFVDPSVTDNCGSTTLKTGYAIDGTVVVAGCTSSQTRTWIYVDPCGNESVPFVQTITWTTDTQKPSVTGVATITGTTCNVKPVFVDPTATDNCGSTTLKAGYPLTSTVSVSGCTSTQTRTWVYLDPCGNESDPFVQTISWTTDTQKPTITGTTTITGSTCNVKPALVDPTATDNCGATALKAGYPQTSTVNISSCNSSQTRTWIYVDPCGNESDPFIQTITWTTDTQKPTVTGTTTVTGSTCNMKPAFVDPTATDNCGSTTLKAGYPIDGTVVVAGCTSSQTRTWIYVDPCGNESVPFIQTITWTTDTQKPTVTGTATITGSACNVKPAFVDPTATDNCGSSTIKAGYPIDGTANAMGCSSTQTRTWIYVDPCGNESDPFIQTLTWTTDTQKPTITGTATITGNTCNVKPAFVDPTAADNCGATTLKAGYPQTSTVNVSSCTSTQTRTWIYVDPCGNESDPFVQTITWTTDTQKPTLTCPAPQQFCVAPGGNYAIPSLIANDNCSGALTINWTITGASNRSGSGINASGSFNSGVSVITWTVTDACGNTETCTTPVTINVASTSSTNASVCINQLPYNWNSQNYSATGSYSVKLVNAAGCDSVAILNLVVKPVSTSTSNLSICTNQTPYTWNGQNYTTTGTYIKALTSAAGCDSIATLNLKVNSTLTSTTNTTICNNQLPYTWNGQSYTAAGTYTKTLTSASGCDSIVTLNLTVNTTLTSTSNTSICTNQLPYVWNGQSYNAAGTYTKTLISVSGCDSIATLNLSVNPTLASTSNIAVCSNQLPYAWNGQLYNSTGTYTKTLVSVAGCDSIATLNLLVKPVLMSTTNLSICTNQTPYSWNGQNYITTGTYTKALVSATGCDSIATLNLVVKPVLASSTNLSICTNQTPYLWNGQNYTVSGTYTKTLTSAAGCDSVATLNLVVKAVLASSTNIDICTNQAPYTWNGQTYTITGTYTRTLTSAAGCDSIATLNLTVKAVVTSTTNLSICINQTPYLWNGQNYAATGNYTKTLTSVSGCDSVATLNLVVKPVLTSTTNLSICTNQTPYTWNGQNYNTTGTYPKTLTSAAGCDSIATLNLVVKPVVTSTTNISVCTNQIPYTWNGQSYSTTGTYTKTLTSASGCDSIATLNLVVKIPTTSTTNLFICTNQTPYTWNGQNYTTTGTYTKTLTNAAGCDSVATLNLTVNSTLSSTTNAGICTNQLPYLWNGQWYTTAGTYTKTLTSASGCDSIATLNLAVNSILTGTTNKTICTNQLPFVWNGQSYNAAGTYTKTLTSVSGCDSIATLNLAVNSVLTSTTNTSICANQIPYTWNGQNYNVTGTFTKTLTSAAGCDSIATLNLVVKPLLTSTSNVDICTNQAPYTWNGQNYTISGTYTKTLTSAAGCDSIATLNLTVKFVVTSTTNLSICINQTPYLWNGQNYTTTGTYTKTLTSSSGCDSIPTLNLVVKPVVTSTTNVSICINQTPYTWNGQNYTATGTYTKTLTSAAGCDSIATLNLVVKPVVTSTTNISVCTNQTPYTWNGQNYNTTGTYTKTLTSAAGCDSIATLNLEVKSTTTSITTLSICTNQTPYTWNGQTYTMTGTYTKTLINAGGCDSIATLNLTVNSILSSTTNLIICNNQLPYSWNGQSYTAAGTYTKILTSASGCDSVVTLNLAVNTTLTSTTNTMICSNQLPYTWNGQSYNAGGTYTKTLLSISGCDSIATLNLVINSILTGTTNTSVCTNQLPYTWNGQSYNAAGTYTKALTSVSGCDSIATLNLTVKPAVTSTSNISICTNQTPYTWNGQNYTTTGTYTKTLTSATGCDSIATLNLVAKPLVTSTTNISICTNQMPYTWNGQIYTISGTYTKTLTSTVGCDSIATLNLIVNPLVTSTTNIAICTNQTPYTWNGQAYSTTGTYTKTLTSAAGCDSIATLNLAVNSSLTSTTNITICNNQLPYTWNGQSYTAAGTYTKTLSSVSGCDSIVTLNLTVNTTLTSTTNITICSNQLPYSWNGQSYTAAGSYSKTLTSVSGCDSIATLNLTVNTMLTSTTNTAICTNQLPYTWNGKSYAAAGTYTKTLTSTSGCDSVATLNLTLKPAVTSSTNISICTNQTPYTWNGQTYSATGTYTKTLTSSSGCDSIASLNLLVKPVATSTTNLSICTNQTPYTWNGQAYSTTGTYTKTLTSAVGCDSIATLNLAVNSILTSTTNTTICNNQLPYTWNGQSYTVAGTYTKTLTSVSGCDSIATLNLTVNTTLISTTNIVICNNQLPYTWNGQSYAAAGTYARTLTSVSGCDSIATMNLTINTTLTSTTNIAICNNQLPYTWNGRSYTAAGTYTKTLTSVSGCDSIATLNLTLKPVVTSTTNFAICTNQTPYTWNGQAYTTTGAYIKTLTSAAGCDSIATLNLVVKPVVTSVTDLSICTNQIPYTWNGQSYTISGTYTKTLTSSAGCDSVATLNLVVNSTLSSTTNTTICTTQLPYTWNGQSYTAAGIYTKTLTSSSGCDSIATLNLTVNTTLTSTTNITICTSQLPYTWNGQSYNAAGTYPKTLLSVSGCDSIVTLNLTVNTILTSTTNIAICNNQLLYMWNGQSYTVAGTYTKTLTSVSGCDSIATLNLVVNSILTSTTNTAICNNQLPYTWNGQSYTAAGTYTKTLTSVSGCDSIATLNLTVKPTVTSTTNISICINQTPYAWNGQSYTTTGTYTKTLTSAGGCDSIATLNLVVKPVVISTTNLSICTNQTPYTWNGQTYTISGTYTKTLTSAAGCDSIATLNLTVNSTLSSTTNTTICTNQLPYSWNGQSYTAAGTYTKTLTSVSGCDSIATLNLTVNTTLTSTTNTTICTNQLPYNWNGQSYTAAGTYTKTLLSVFGCDSIATLNLTVNTILTSTTNTAICNNQLPYTWNGQLYTVAGTYTKTLTSVSGCDSVATLNLTINPISTSTMSQSVCTNQLPFNWNGQSYNTTGTYTKTLTSATGCDSIATLNLVVKLTATSTTNLSICTNQTPYTWNGQTYSATGTYTKTLISSSGCDSIATLNLTVNTTLTSTTNTIICTNQLPYSWNGQSYTAAGTYTKTLTSVSGCDSIATLNLTVNTTLTSTKNTAICTNQLPYNWNGQSYTAAGTYTKTLTSVSGCDSIATLNLIVNTMLTSTTNTTICTNQLPYTWNGQSYTAAGTYTKTLTSASGCDSIATLNLIVNTILTSTTSTTICTNQLPYSWNGQSYNAAGTYTKTLTSASGCDSVATLNLEVNATLASTTNTSICTNQLPYNWNGQSYNAAGTYSKTLKSTGGCDSIAALNLEVNATLTSTINTSICTNQLPYNWHGQSYNATGTYKKTLKSTGGCDSIVTLNLIVNETLTSTTTSHICKNQLPFTWHGQSYNAPGIYKKTFKAASGCDSVVTLDLVVNEIATSTTNVKICVNQLPYHWNGQARNGAGNYKTTLKASNGCDSIATLNLEVTATLTSTTDANICSQELPYNWNGQSYNAAGSYRRKLTSAGGCDSIATLNLKVSPASNTSKNVTFCGNSYQLPGGIVATISGTYKTTLKNTAGCDSVVTTVLQLNQEPVLKITDPAEVCVPGSANLSAASITAGNASGLLYTYWTNAAATIALANPSAVTVAGSYYIRATNQAGCSSVKPVSVSINPLPVLQVNNPPITCAPGVVDITTPDITAGSGADLNFSYWTNANGTTALPNPKAITSPGIYYIRATSPKGCGVIKPVQITFTTPPVVVITNPASVCEPATVDLTNPLVTTGSDPGLTYTYWMDAAATIPITNPKAVGTSGVYYIRAFKSGNCFTINPVKVVVFITKSIEGVRYPTLTGSINIPLQLQARAIGISNSYLWQPPGGLNQINIKAPIFRYDKETEYTIHIKQQNGCETVDTIFVRLKNNVKCPEVFVPKAWSPNKDGHNDQLFPLTTGPIQLKFFRVFNRWGQLVFETKEVGQGWDGIFKGQPQVKDVYTWTLEAKGLTGDGCNYFLAGNALLLR